MARRALSALLVALGATAVGRSGRCAPPNTSSVLNVEASVCPGSGLDASEVRRDLSSELEADGVVRVTTQGARDGTLTAQVGCDAALTTHVALSSARSGRVAECTLVLADADPSARSRVLALAASELVRSDWPALSREGETAESRAAYADAPPQPTDAEAKTQLSAAPAALQPTAVPPPRPPMPATTPLRDGGVQRASATPTSPWAISANARLRYFVDFASFAAGGDAGPDWGPFRARAELLVTRADDALGSATLGIGALCIGYRLFERKLGPLSVTGYPLLSAGVTWLRGTSARFGVQSAPATGFYGDVRLAGEARWADATLSPVLSAEVGRATGFVARASDRVLGATGGFFVGASAGGRY